MLKREKVKLTALVKRWREDATELMRLRKTGGHPDTVSPVRMYVEAQVLRDVARTLKRRIDSFDKN